jgi:hypothetical protein
MIRQRKTPGTMWTNCMTPRLYTCPYHVVFVWGAPRNHSLFLMHFQYHDLIPPFSWFIRVAPQPLPSRVYTPTPNYVVVGRERLLKCGPNFNEFPFISVALKLIEIWVDLDRNWDRSFIADPPEKRSDMRSDMCPQVTVVYLKFTNLKVLYCNVLRSKSLLVLMRVILFR